MKYAIKIPMPDDGWMYVTDTDTNGNTVVVTYDTKKLADAVNFGVWGCQGRVVEYHKDPFGNPTDKLTDEEIEELRAKKQAIKEELYDKVKMEMFMASSELEGFKTITKEETELFEKLKKIWLHGVPEKSGLYFICGEVGDKDAMGLPEKILVCPAYGSDGMAVYTKTTDYSAPSY